MLPRGQSSQRLGSVSKSKNGPYLGGGDSIQQIGGSVSINNNVLTLTHSTVITSTSSSIALVSNTSAKYRLFQNVDTTSIPPSIITIAFATTAVAFRQITLYPGQFFEMSLVEGNMDTRQVNCIANSGNPILLVTEGV